MNNNSVYLQKVACFCAAVGLLLLVSCASREIVPSPSPQKPARIAVVLGAGAARGFAHIGVLKVLESHQVPIDIIVGTSVGSLVGSIYAAGFNAFQMQTMAMNLQKDDVIDYILPDNGFVRGYKLETFVNKTVNKIPLEKMRIPLRVIATDIRSGEEMVFATGNTGWAVRASCAVPGVFQPVQIGNNTYVDGGVVSPVAVNAARQAGADVVIAVDISTRAGVSVPQGTVDTILQAIDIMHARISDIQLKNADVIIRPKIGHIGATDFEKRYEAILEGEKAASLAMPQIQQIIARFRQEGRLAN
ncbi:MAG: patatin-like phospholipase family protein [Syntrophales bacterium]|jgi:NTE family protein|nr:patatin-like phospholipase family protein [Syntrophales bacterium]